MKKLPYSEGDICCVPLRDMGFVLGVIARVPKGRKVLLGYFFGSRIEEFTAMKGGLHLNPSLALKVIKFGDRGLMNGSWPIIGSVEGWNRTEWLIPKFIRKDDLRRRSYLISYSDDNLRNEIAQEPCEYDLSGYEPDSLFGYGVVEILMTKLATPGYI